MKYIIKEEQFEKSDRIIEGGPLEKVIKLILKREQVFFLDDIKILYIPETDGYFILVPNHYISPNYAEFLRKKISKIIGNRDITFISK